MTNVSAVVLACLVGVSLASSGERIGAHRRPSNPALRANAPDPNLFIPLPMVRNVRMQSDDHYELDIETANGVRRTEVGDMDDNGNNAVKGVIQYTLPDGTPFILRYIADETGFHPQGNMLPTPPPMPAHSMAQMKAAGMLHHSSEENAMFDSMENDPMFKSMEHMFRSMEDHDDDLFDDSFEVNTFKRNTNAKAIQNKPSSAPVRLNQPSPVRFNQPSLARLNHPSTAQIVRFDSVEDRFDSPEDRFDSPEDRFNSPEDILDSIEDRYDSLEDILNARKGIFDSRESREDRVVVRENRFNSRGGIFVSKESLEDRFDSRENTRVPIKNNPNSQALLSKITNRGGVLLRNRNTGKIVLLRNRKVIDSFERDDFRSREDNTFEDLTLEDNTKETIEDFSIENRTDEIDSFENRTDENDSLEFRRLNPSIRTERGRVVTRG